MESKKYGEIMKQFDRWDHLRWKHSLAIPLSWRGTLEAMCAYYGSFAGRWHLNDEWKYYAELLPSLSEAQARTLVIDIEREADARMMDWRQSQ